MFQRVNQRIPERIVKRGCSAGIEIVQLLRKQAPVRREIRDYLNIVAEADDRDPILRTGGVQKVARSFTNEIDPFFDAAGNIQQEDEVEGLSRRRDVYDL